ncbi:hypothetical protein SAMN04488581_1636 [Mycolicibacterium neoaurum]|uniref:Uncharacterized protein n=1 Tax=Mycolicibacterium neoaurum TaxID=1795 RepID=A0AAV2WSA7_MYCNE|nr:hypothetical protein BN1047_04881 [Mycolicibacterium neoaurum]SDD00059.1 hypothetical protein SAMN04488581_1636 [Mycolicibacterium neoaurum]
MTIALPTKFGVKTTMCDGIRRKSAGKRTAGIRPSYFGQFSAIRAPGLPRSPDTWMNSGLLSAGMS